MARLVADTAVDMSNWDNLYDDSSGADIGEHDDTHFVATADVHTFTVTGENFEYEEVDDDIVPTDGTVHTFSAGDDDGTHFQISHMSNDAATIASYVASEDWDAFASDVFSGKDTIIGSADGDHLRGFFGADRIEGGKGRDTISGDAGSDRLTGGAAGDDFNFNEATDSTGVQFDTVTDFHTANDIFGVAADVNEIEDAITNGTLRKRHFDSDLADQIGTGELGSDGAVLFSVSDGGRYDGRTFLIVNFSDGAGYQANRDLVIDVTGLDGTLSTDNFLTI